MHRRHLALGLLIPATLMLAGCGHRTTGPAAASGLADAGSANTAAAVTAPAAPPPAAPIGNAADACRTFTVTLYRSDTSTDRSPADAYRRASAYATGRLAATLAATPAVSSAQWTTWREHRARTEVTLSPLHDSEQPADTADQAYRGVTATIRPVGRDGWRGVADTAQVMCTLTRIPGGWSMLDYQIDDITASTP